MLNYLLLVLAALLMTANFVVNKVFQKKAGDGLLYGLWFNAVHGLITIICFLALNGFRIEFTLYSIIQAVVTGVLAVAYTIVGFRIMSGGKMAYYSLFLMCGAMIVPYVWGLLFLGEPFSWLQMLGLLLIVAAIVFPNIGKDKLSRSQLLLCIAVFLLCGFLNVASKLHQIEANYPTISPTSFVMWSGGSKFVICGILYFILRTKSEDKKAVPVAGTLPIWVIVILAALVSGLSYLFQLIGAAELPATVVYPFVTGGSIVFTTFAGWMFFKEKPSTKLWIGVALCMAGTLLFL